MTPRLSARDLKAALEDSLDALRASRGAIDAANVYPVPDADTGTNLVMTLEAVVRAAAFDPDGDIPTDPSIAAAIADGALNGARGNSGVIIAQVLRAWADAVAEGPLGPPELAAAFRRATTLAYASILEPAEGTVLSVLRAARDAVEADHPDVRGALQAGALAARDALALTPSQMPLLAQAGVVDAGGIGLVLILDALARRVGATLSDYAPEAPADPAACARAGVITFPFEVQYLLAAPEAAAAVVRQALGSLGDSIAVVGGGERWRVHVHTDRPDEARALGEAAGTIEAYEVVDLRAQVEAAVTSPTPAPSTPAPSTPAPSTPAPSTPAPSTVAATTPTGTGARGIPAARTSETASLIAVAPGAGARELFVSLGAHVLTAAPADVTSAALADEIARAGRPAIVLPNDEELYARAAPELDAADCAVLRTGDAAQGLAVALAYTDTLPFDRCLIEMRAALERVRSGQVIVSPQRIETPAGVADEGAVVAVAEGTVVAIESDPEAAVVAAARALLDGGGALTVLCGADVDGAERARVEQALRDAFGAIDIDVHAAGQQRHRYLLSAE